MANTETIADTPQAIRARLDLTQEQLADRLGVSFTTVSRWQGGVNLPQKAARAAIAALSGHSGGRESYEWPPSVQRISRSLGPLPWLARISHQLVRSGESQSVSIVQAPRSAGLVARSRGVCARGALWGRRRVPSVAACRVLSCPNRGLRFYSGAKLVFRSVLVRNAG